MIKKFLSIVLCLLFLPGVSLASDSEKGEEYVYIPAEDLYTDVTIDTAYRYAIGWLSSRGAIQGYPDGTFRLNQTVNRAEFLKMLHLALNTQTDTAYDSRYQFSDVDPNEWFAGYVSAAKKRGTIQGYPDGTFRPSQSISRAEGMKIIMNEILGSDAGAYLSSFSEEDKKAVTGCYNRFMNDVERDSWYERYAIHLHDRCIIPGQMVHDHLLHPAQPLTRGETAELIFRALVVRDNANLRYSPSMDPA